MSKRTVVLILIGIIIIAAVMRFYALDRQSLWYDEFAEETAFQRQFLIKGPVLKPYTPPLNLFFIYPMTRMFPRSDLALRIVPFAFGLISVPLLFLFGKQMFDEKIGLIASFLLSISPFHIWYSQEARMYALQWMLALISMIFFLRILEKPGRGNYTGYVISTTAGLYTHQLAVFILVLQGLYVLLFYRKYKQHFFKLLGVLGANTILYLPWIIYSLTSFTNKPTGVPKEIDLKVILYTFYSYCAGFSIGPSLRELHIDQTLAVMKPYLFIAGSLMAVYGILFALGLWSLRKNRSNLLLLLLLLIMPIVSVLILNKILPNITYNVRYTGTALFGFLIFIAKGIDWLTCLKSKFPGKIIGVITVIIITGFSAYSYANYQFNKKYAKPDIRGAVTYIREKRMPGDIILSITSSGTMIFNRYSREPIFSLGFSSSTIPNSKKDIEAELQKIVVGKKRFWLILYQEWGQPTLVSYTRSWLDTNYEEIKKLRKGVTEIANIQIYSYDLTKKKTSQKRI